MKQTRIIMGMPITIEVADSGVEISDIEEIFNYFKYIDQKFSTYKKNSEISQINDGRLKLVESSPDMKIVFKLAEKTKKQTYGFFDIYYNGKIDLSGIVKGWAIYQAFKILKKRFRNFYIDCGGDIQVFGKNTKGEPWRVGIKNPFNQKQIVKVIVLKKGGMATSGNYIRGDHIYNPKSNKKIDDIVSLTVIGPNAYEADRFATAAFAMGKAGIEFIEKLRGLEGYMIDKNGIATMTSNFEKYTI